MTAELSTSELGWFRRELGSPFSPNHHPNAQPLSPELSGILEDKVMQEAIKNQDIKTIRQILATKGGLAWDDAW